MNNEIHVGKLIEDVIRSNYISISSVARKIHVNRRSVYNWFKQSDLRPYTLHRICYVLVYDYSVKLPEYFKEEFIDKKNFKSPLVEEINSIDTDPETNSVEYWINKYVYLLEKYNDALAKGIIKEDLYLIKK